MKRQLHIADRFGRRAHSACVVLMAISLLSNAPSIAADNDPLAAYYSNTYLWKNQQTNAVGRMWLNRDGKYYAFYNMGPQEKMPADDASGPWQVQGREGTYTVRGSAVAGYQLCLWPAAPRIVIGAERQQELYSEGRCYAFTPRVVGEVWNAKDDPRARDYKFWLVPGR